ncbi:MAG: diguanylate cyclase, partial [Lachnospiraceae bacterium]|nr:diguanylate cyclase [Lachnospiraceae bacterium]
MKSTTVIKRITHTIFGIACVIAAEIVILFVKDRKLAYYAFSFYYIAFTWYAMMIFRFTVVYCRHKELKLYKIPLFWITITETIALVWGMFSERFFLITHAKWYGHIYWISRCFPIFYIYAAIIGVALAATLVMLVVAAVKSARIYRLKFVSIIVVLSVMAICCLISQLNRQPMLVQVILLALCELIIIYMAVYYAPRKLNQRAMRFVADKLNDGIVLYDDEHQLQLVTEGYREAFGVTNIQALSNERSYWRKMFSEAKEENAWNGSVKSVIRDGEKFYYEIQYLALNEDNKHIGTVYWIRNVTEAIENYRSMVRRANFDEITGIYNEAYFHESARKVLEDNPDTTFVMTCSSIEKHRVFKELFGKQKFDDYLIKTGEILKRGLANFPNCRYGKIGESDFYVMMPKELFVPDQLTDSIESVAKLFSTNNYHLNIKAGVYEIKETSYNMLAICNKASMACDAIRGDYGKKIMWFDEKTQSEFMKRERYNAELSDAIENGDIQIYLQPQ